MKQLKEFCKVLQEINATKEEVKSASYRLAQLKDIKDNATTISILAKENGTCIEIYEIDECLNMQESQALFFHELEEAELRRLSEAKGKLKRLSEELAQTIHK